MTKTNSLDSYPYCKEIWDEAYASPTGTVLITLPSRAMSKSEQATLIGDLLHYRVLVRKSNSQFWPPGHPQHMTSIFDPFTVMKVDEDGQFAVRIKRRTASEFKITVEEPE